jgi:hypothetical protein
MLASSCRSPVAGVRLSSRSSCASLSSSASAAAFATQSEQFRLRWAAHNVRFHDSGSKHLHHPAVGDLTLSFNRLDLAADDGLKVFTYAAEPGSRSEEALRLLGSWGATLESAESRTI